MFKVGKNELSQMESSAVQQPLRDVHTTVPACAGPCAQHSGGGTLVSAAGAGRVPVT